MNVATTSTGCDLAKPGDRAQHLQLAVEVEAVAALDLARGRTAGEHLVEPRPGLGDQFVFAGGARRRDRGHDAATGGGDAGIGFTGEAPAQFRTAVAGVDGVRVGVDEAGNDREVADVDDARVRRQRQGVFELAGGTGECDPLARDGEGAVGDDLELSLPGSAARRGPGAGYELTAVPEDQHACRQPRSSAARGASLDHCAGAAGASAWRGRCSRTLSSEPVLFADELERPVERLDRALERALDVASAQAHLVDVALDFFEPTLCLLQQQVGAALGLADDELGFGLRRLLDFVGQALRGQQRVAQVGLAVTVLVEERFLAHQVLAQAVDLAQRVLVVVGGLGEEGDDFGTVEAAQLGAETLLLEIERRDPHDPFGRRRSGVGGRSARWRVRAIEHQSLLVVL